MRPERRIAIAKDLILFFGGLAGIGYQTVTRDVNTMLLIIYTTMIGIPGVTNLVSLMRGSATESESQQQASEPSDTN